MSDKNTTTLEITQSKLPRFYKKYESDKSILATVLKAVCDELDVTQDKISRVNDCIGINTTNNRDLYHRWGSLLSIDKKQNQTYDSYHGELKRAIPSLIGGNRDSIVYIIATCIGIERDDNSVIDNYIDVVDAWEYDGDVTNIDTSYGNFVCTIDLGIVSTTAVDLITDIRSAIKRVKASGTDFFVVYTTSYDDVGSASVLNGDDFYDYIRTEISEHSNIVNDGCDNTVDNVKHTSSDVCDINSSSNNYLRQSTNSVLHRLNSSFIINKAIDCDECIDTIECNGIITKLYE